MKAIIYDKKQSATGFALRQIDEPVPADNEVLVKVLFVSLNAGDYRSIQLGMIPKRKIFGADIAGRIVSVGKAVEKFKIGDEVVGDLSSCGFGGMAEYVAVPEHALVAKPAHVPFEVAAATPLAAVTALQALKKAGDIKPGERIFISGGGGGVGTFAVQLAKYYQAHVTVTCSEKNVEILKAIGSDVVLDYKKTDFSANSEAFDKIFAVNGHHSLSTYKKALVKGGQCVVVGGTIRQILFVLLFGAVFSIGNKKIQVLSAKPNTQDLAFILDLIGKGEIKPVIDRQYNLEEADQAMAYLLSGHVSGKILLKVGAEQ